MKEFTQPDLIDLENGIDWLTKHLPSQQVLVACRQGLGRSASLVIAYLCCQKHVPYETAVRQVTDKRPGTTPLPRLSLAIDQIREKTANGPH